MSTEVFINAYEALDKVQQCAADQGIENFTEAFTPEILMEVVSLELTKARVPSGVSLNYRVDWTKFNEVVEANRPLDRRTLETVYLRVTEALSKAGHHGETFAFVRGLSSSRSIIKDMITESMK